MMTSRFLKPDYIHSISLKYQQNLNDEQKDYDLSKSNRLENSAGSRKES